MSLTRSFAPMAVALSMMAAPGALAEQAPPPPSDEMACDDARLDLDVMISGFVNPSTVSALSTDSDCVANLQYKLLQDGYYTPFGASNTAHEKNIAKTVNGKFDLQTQQAVARYLGTLALNQERPELSNQLGEMSPEQRTLIDQYSQALPPEEVQAYSVMLLEVYKNRAYHLAMQQKLDTTRGYITCVQHYTNEHGQDLSTMQERLKDWKGTFGLYVDLACDNWLSDLSKEDRQDAEKLARHKLAEYIARKQADQNAPDISGNDTAPPHPPQKAFDCTPSAYYWLDRCAKKNIHYRDNGNAPAVLTGPSLQI